MRIAIAQINPTLADFEINSKKILQYTAMAKERHCDLVVFPEASLFGYHPFDMLEISEVVQAQNRFLKMLEKKIPAGIGIFIGAMVPTGSQKGRPYFNAAVFLEKGKKSKFFFKELLPTGDVFDEARFIESGDMNRNLLVYKGKRLFVTICEDIWAWPDAKGNSSYKKNPLQESAKKTKNIDLVVNLSASPFYPGKEKIRLDLVKKTAALFKSPMIYCNLVGAQDEIIFDGQSFALDKKGQELARLMPFEEDLGVIDLAKMQGMRRPDQISDTEKIRRALVLGIRDFCTKAEITNVHLGLSGGVDSALVACLAVDALGPAHVAAFALPSQFNAPESLELAQKLAKNLGIKFQKISIQKPFEEIKKLIDDSYQVKEFGLVHENLQSRLRGLLMMAYSNASRSMLLSTGNKSELASGFATLYGDLCGGLMPIADLTKAQVYAISKLYNQDQEMIPAQILERAPSAELAPNQKDQDRLPEYKDLDKAVDKLVVEGRLGNSKAEKFLLTALLNSEFKRWQAPPILKVSKHSFGRGRRWPIAHQAKKWLG